MDAIKFNIGGVDVDVNKEIVSKAIETGEPIKIESESIVVRKKEEWDQYTQNLEKEKKARYDAGYETAEKRSVKALAQEFGIENTEGIRSIADLKEAGINFFKKTTGEPVEKELQEYKSALETANNRAKELESEFTSYKTSIQQREEASMIDNIIEKEIKKHKGDGEFVIPESEIQLIYKSMYRPAKDGDSIVVKNDAGILKNPNTLNPLSINETMPEFIKKYMKQPAGGRGDGDGSGNPAPGSFDSFIEEMDKKGYRPGSYEFNKVKAERIKAGTLKI